MLMDGERRRINVVRIGENGVILMDKPFDDLKMVMKVEGVQGQLDILEKINERIKEHIERTFK